MAKCSNVQINWSLVSDGEPKLIQYDHIKLPDVRTNVQRMLDTPGTVSVDVTLTYTGGRNGS